MRVLQKYKASESHTWAGRGDEQKVRLLTLLQNLVLANFDRSGPHNPKWCKASAKAASSLPTRQIFSARAISASSRIIPGD